MADSKPAGPYLVRPNSDGVVSLGDLPDYEEYMAQRRGTGEIILRPVTKTPFIGESGKATPTPT